jgi:hypothetical protein
MTTAATTHPKRTKRRVIVALVAAALVVGVGLLIRELDLRGRTARETPTFATMLQRARLVGLRDFGRDPELSVVLAANYVSPALVSRLARPGRHDAVRWRQDGDGWALLDAKERIVPLDAEGRALRLGSLVLYPTDTADEPVEGDWSIVVLAGGRLRETIVIRRDGSHESLDAEAFAARLAELNARRSSLDRAQREDPRSLPDRLAAP